MKTTSSILCVCSILFLSSLTTSAQKILKLGDFGEVRVTYMLVSNNLPEKVKAMTGENFTVNMVDYPDAKLGIKIEVLNIENNHTVSVGPQSMPEKIHGFTRSRSTFKKLKQGETLTVLYDFYLNTLDKNNAVLRATVFVKDRAGNTVGEQKGYHANGQRYQLILPEPERPDSKARVEAEAWEKARKLDTKSAYESFLMLFPDGAHAEMAMEKIRRFPSPPPARPKPEISFNDEKVATSSLSKKAESFTPQAIAPADSLSADYTMGQNGDLHLQIHGGHPPFELRFLLGEVYVVGIIKLEEERDIHLTKEQVAEAKIPSGTYQLRVVDKFGQHHQAATCPQPYELPKTSARMPRWILVAFSIGLVFVIGYYLGGKRGG
jgi:hypothetical protein